MHFFVLLLALLSSPAYAEQKTLPLDEYNNVRPGMLLIEEEGAKQNDQKIPDKPQSYSEIATYKAMTFEDVQRVYREGKYTLAAEHIMNLADSGLPAAEELLGLMYRNGEGFQKDTRKAFMWLSKAAENTRPLAQHHVGSMYYEGDGVEADRVKALMWLTLSSLYYPKGPERERAAADRNNLSQQVSRRERDSALELTKEWLGKRGEKKLLESLQ